MPISAFFNALRAFQSGQLAFDDLSSEIDRQLRVERTSTEALLEVLKVQQAVRPLPRDAHEAISRHIADWPQDPTVVTGARPRAADGSVGVGDILKGRFSLVAMIGEGGMSRVFLARHGELATPVVIKTLLDADGGGNVGRGEGDYGVNGAPGMIGQGEDGPADEAAHGMADEDDAVAARRGLF